MIQPYFQNAFANESIDYVIVPSLNTFTNDMTRQNLIDHYHRVISFQAC